MRTNGKTKRSIKRSSAEGKRGHSKEVASVTGTDVTVIGPLSASSLKNVLWETLTDLKHENIMPNRADAIAAQSREILRTIKIQLQIAGQAKHGVPKEIIDFSEK